MHISLSAIEKKFPSKVTRICENAFCEFSELEKVEFSENLNL